MVRLESVVERVKAGERVDVTRLDDRELQRVVVRLRREGYVLGLDLKTVKRVVRHRNGKEETVLELRRYLYIKRKEVSQ